jgi:hypothetical protein
VPRWSGAPAAALFHITHSAATGGLTVTLPTWHGEIAKFCARIPNKRTTKQAPRARGRTGGLGPMTIVWSPFTAKLGRAAHKLVGTYQGLLGLSAMMTVASDLTTSFTSITGSTSQLPRWLRMSVLVPLLTTGHIASQRALSGVPQNGPMALSDTTVVTLGVIPHLSTDTDVSTRRHQPH